MRKSLKSRICEGALAVILTSSLSCEQRNSENNANNNSEYVHAIVTETYIAPLITPQPADSRFVIRFNTGKKLCTAEIRESKSHRLAGLQIVLESNIEPVDGIVSGDSKYHAVVRIKRKALERFEEDNIGFLYDDELHMALAEDLMRKTK